MRGMSKVIVVMLAVYVAPALSGCQEHLCSEGEYPVYTKGTLDTSGPQGTNDGGAGQTCIKDGFPVPSGYASYAPGHTPTIG